MTNTTAAAFLILSALLIFIAFDAESPPAVIDIDGKPVRSNTDYFILPLIRGRGGGLTLIAVTNTSICPLAVAQADLEVDRGLPVTFTPIDPKKGVNRESTDLNIEFKAVTICIVSTVWQLAGPDESTGKYFVSIGGMKGNPGKETTANWFKIVKNGRDYNLKFFPTVCNTCKLICRDVGVSFDAEDKWRLVLSDDPFRVRFKKAEDQLNHRTG